MIPTSCIFFFSIPAHGHVNPTLPVVRELVSRGHRVIYYETEAFREKIEAAGAQFIPVDAYMPPAPPDIEKKAGKDFASLIGMVADTTISLDERIAQDVATFQPDCVVSDSVCFWGKLLAKKHGLPFICSTTTLAFNQHTAASLKPGLREMLSMILGMPRIEAKMKLLRANGHDVPDFVSVIQNDNETDTLVYTSRLFQPKADTFSSRYAFVGPCVQHVYPRQSRERPLVYISLGTVLGNAPKFYRRCIDALRDMDLDVVISTGGALDPAALGKLPEHITVHARVNQLDVLASADVFITHCGMNSVNESLLNGVPMALYPLHSEENAVAARVEALGAGLRLGRPTARRIRQAIESLLHDKPYREAAQAVAANFAQCGGAKEAADFIEARCS